MRHSPHKPGRQRSPASPTGLARVLAPSWLARLRAFIDLSQKPGCLAKNGPFHGPFEDQFALSVFFSVG
jgi:hypothetical protein